MPRPDQNARSLAAAGESPAVRILVADDDAEMRALLRAMLHGLATIVSEVGSGGDLLTALADQGPFDVVITDVRMPSPSGLQVVSMARAAGLLTPFVVITAFPDARLRDRVAGMRGALLLDKPFEREALLSAVHMSLRGEAHVQGMPATP